MTSPPTSMLGSWELLSAAGAIDVPDYGPTGTIGATGSILADRRDRHKRRGSKFARLSERTSHH